jgi:DNA polymerase-4
VDSSSIGFAANRQLAKIACKAGKKTGGSYGDGMAIWHPRDMAGPLLDLTLGDIPGIDVSMMRRLYGAGIITVRQLLDMQPKQMRQLWHSFTGERLWYALYGYAVQTPPSGRSMYGHGRVLPPEAASRSMPARCPAC